MKTQNEHFGRDSAYWGENGAWLVGYAIHRDSDCLARSNWRVLMKRLGGESETVQVERASHWAVGWLDYLIIAPGSAEQIAIVEQALAEIESYPVLDDEDFSAEEQREADETWRNCYSPADRIEYIRKYRSQFEFGGLGDMLGCVRGNYFAGYASELLT